MIKRTVCILNENCVVLGKLVDTGISSYISCIFTFIIFSCYYYYYYLLKGIIILCHIIISTTIVYYPFAWSYCVGFVPFTVSNMAPFIMKMCVCRKRSIRVDYLTVIMYVQKEQSPGSPGYSSRSNH